MSTNSDTLVIRCSSSLANSNVLIAGLSLPTDSYSAGICCFGIHPNSNCGFLVITFIQCNTRPHADAISGLVMGVSAVNFIIIRWPKF